MPQLIATDKELIRINPTNNHIEYSRSRGLSWMTRYSGSSVGTFRDLLEKDGKLFACTSKGVYYSTSNGLSWMCRNASDYTRTFTCLQSSGREMLAATSDGHLYYSVNDGLSWMRRR